MSLKKTYFPSTLSIIIGTPTLWFRTTGHHQLCDLAKSNNASLAYIQ